MSDTLTTPCQRRTPVPPTDVRALGRLVGTWRVRDGAEGAVTYEWLEGGFFLLKRVDLVRDGETIRGIEVIGHEQPHGGDGGGEIRSRYYDNAGHTLDYVYELEGDTLTVWTGEKGSSAYYRGVFSIDGTTLTGRWVHPGGYGYDASAIRIGGPPETREAIAAVCGLSRK